MCVLYTLLDQHSTAQWLSNTHWRQCYPLRDHMTALGWSQNTVIIIQTKVGEIPLMSVLPLEMSVLPLERSPKGFLKGGGVSQHRDKFIQWSMICHLWDLLLLKRPHDCLKGWSHNTATNWDKRKRNTSHENFTFQRPPNDFLKGRSNNTGINILHRDNRMSNITKGQWIKHDQIFMHHIIPSHVAHISHSDSSWLSVSQCLFSRNSMCEIELR